jgi:F-type H+-transporting ATPase subunit beta
MARLLASRGSPRGPILETGIKVLDVFAPIRRGGTVLVHAGFGVGKLVLLGELTHRVARRGGHSVYVSWRQRYYRPDDAMHEMREMGVADFCTFLVGDLTDPLPTLQRGLDATAQLRSEGRDVLLFVDQATSQPLALEPLAPTSEGSLTIVSYDLEPPNGTPQAGDFDTIISFSADLAKASIYPAVDPLASSSNLFETGELEAEHVRTALAARDALRAGGERGRRLQLFQSQPFFVAEPWTAKPGLVVPLRESLASYAALLDGAFHQLSDQQLLYAGAIVKPGA